MVAHITNQEIDEMSKEYNKIFTRFQKLDKKLASWEPLSANTKDKWEKILAQQQISGLTKQNQLLEQQIFEMQSHTKWFVTLTIVIIIVTLIDLFKA